MSLLPSTLHKFKSSKRGKVDYLRINFPIMHSAFYNLHSISNIVAFKPLLHDFGLGWGSQTVPVGGAVLLAQSQGLDAHGVEMKVAAHSQAPALRLYHQGG